MNVLQAMDKLKEYGEKLRVLDTILTQLEGGSFDFCNLNDFDIQLLKDIEVNYTKKHDDLYNNLKGTYLVSNEINNLR